MTIKELKEHCIRQITEFERIKEIMPVTQNDYKRYEEHKIVLQLIEASEQKEKIMHCKDCKFRDYLGDCNKWSKELDAHKSIHIDDVYRLIAGHSNYHGDSILSTLTCIAEGKNVTKPITPLDKEDCSFEKMSSVTPKEKTGKWINEKWHGLDLIGITCSNCGIIESRFSAYCPNCGAKMEVIK